MTISPTLLDVTLIDPTDADLALGDTLDESADDYPTYSAAELDTLHRANLFISGDDITPDTYPRLYNISAGFMYSRIVRAEVPDRPEYVTVPLDVHLDDEEGTRLSVAITRWNLLWESAQFRRRLFDEEDLPFPMNKIADRGDINTVFVPRTRSRYYEYAPLFHLLPRSTLERFGLPLIRAGQWPYTASYANIDRLLPEDFEQRLSRAWAHAVWRDLMPGSPQSAFSKEDPIKLLAHNLDFWLPPVTEVTQSILRDLPVSGSKPAPDSEVRLIDSSVLDGALMATPRMGSDLWRGECDASETLGWTVAEADADGRLRGILDAVRSNRVEDDFSDRWSFAREDFDRKLYGKRNKVKVRFVELTDTIPVQGPETEVVGELVSANFLALLDKKERQVVVLLTSGVTKLTEVADILGYANHSPVSKRLAKIREKASQYFDQA